MAFLHREYSFSVLALDVSFRCTGYAMVNPKTSHVICAGVLAIKAPPKKRKLRQVDADGECSILLFRQLRDMLKAVGAVIAEFPTGGSIGNRAATCMARASTIALLAAEAEKVPLEVYLPYEAKEAATGNRNAPKEAVQAAIAAFDFGPWSLDSIEPKSHREHVADALAVYLAARNGMLVRAAASGLMLRPEKK